MTARKMFETLGFNYCEDNDYIQYTIINRKKDKLWYVEVCFDKRNKRYWADADFSTLKIGSALLKAIIKQCEELGWVEIETDDYPYRYNGGAEYEDARRI